MENKDYFVKEVMKKEKGIYLEDLVIYVIVYT
jgi:hypothetical protein